MNRDNATKIAKRIMARIENERTIHLDSMVDEIVAGMALVTPNSDAELKRVLAERREGREHEATLTAKYYPLKGSMTIAEPNIGIGFRAFGDSTAISDGKLYLTTGFDVASWDCDPTSGEAEVAPHEAQHDDDHAQPMAPLPAAQNPHGYAHADCHGVWTKQQMIDAGYRNNLEVMRYQPAKPPKARKDSVPISGDYAVAMRWSQDDLYDAGYTPTHHFLLGVQWEPKFD